MSHDSRESHWYASFMEDSKNLSKEKHDLEFKTRMEKDLAMAQDAARDAKVAAFVAEQEADEIPGSDGDGPMKELERVRIAAEEAQKRVEQVSKAVSKLGL